MIQDPDRLDLGDALVYIYISRFICQIITRGGEGIGRGASIHRYTRYTWYVYKILSWLGPIVHFYN